MVFLRRALVVCLLIAGAFAQSPGSEEAKNVASPKQDDKRIAGLIPNYKTVADRDTPVAVMTVKDKFHLAAQDAFDPMAFVVSGMYASIGHAVRQNESWGFGMQGLAKRYGAAVADQIQSSYLQDAIMPALFHQDPRYFRMARGSVRTRVLYAVSRTFVTRSDSGKTQLNAAEFLGNAGQFALSTAYYPAESRTAGEVGTKYLVQFGTDAFFNVVKEYWPDVRRRLFQRH